MSAAKPTDVIPYFLVEVTVSGAIIDTESRIVGDNVVDTTHQFGWRADDLPPGAPDDMVTSAIGKVLVMVSATIQLSMTSSKWVYLGSVEEPDLGRGEVVRVEHTGPIKVLVPLPDQPEHRA